MKNASGMIKGVQLALAGLSGILATAVVGTAAHTYSVFHSQRSENNPWYLPLWPEHFDVTGTKAAIGTGVVVMVLNFGLLAITLIPKITANRPALGALSALTVSICSLLLAIASAVTNRVLDSRADIGGTTNTDTIKTWTCRFKYQMPFNLVENLPSDQSNSSFGSICAESMFDFWGMIAIIIMQFFLLISAVAQWVVNKKASKSPPSSSFNDSISKGDGW